MHNRECVSEVFHFLELMEGRFARKSVKVLPIGGEILKKKIKKNGGSISFMLYN